MDRSPCVYILASGFRGTLYIGVTSDLIARIWQHRQPNRSSFTGRYAVYRLVHVEHFADWMQPSRERNSSSAGTGSGRST